MNLSDLPKLITSDRRQFFKQVTFASVGFAASSFLPSSLFADEASPPPKSRSEQKASADKTLLVERHGKRYEIPFIDSSGSIVHDGYSMLSRVFGDYEAFEAIPMDIELFAILQRAQDFLFKNGYVKPYVITSGYRTDKTNRRTEGSVQGSQHLYGKAIDGRIDGLTPLYMGQMLRACGARGIGIYDTFTHFDTGRMRSWYGGSHHA